MYVRSWKKGNKLYASIVKSVRVGKKVRQETVAYLGVITEEQLPYLKAAYAKNKPRLVYDDDKGIMNETLMNEKAILQETACHRQLFVHGLH